jgi:hypothetical protein
MKHNSTVVSQRIVMWSTTQSDICCVHRTQPILFKITKLKLVYIYLDYDSKYGGNCSELESGKLWGTACSLLPKYRPPGKYWTRPNY